MYISKDKLYHFITGCGISLAVSLVTNGAIGYGVAASLVAGAAKEYWDSCGHGTVDIKDFVATAAGGIIGAAVFVLFREIM